MINMINNLTIVTTKSGTKVYVKGKSNDKRLRDRIGDRFVNVFNQNFTVQEQKQIGKSPKAIPEDL